ncbi:unnamed protein product [Coregonus sp. 'balchen']|nr:unnamed protein product [Coregonus sp. 'balchen']
MALKCCTVVLLVALYMVALRAGLPDRLPDGEVLRDVLLPPHDPKGVAMVALELDVDQDKMKGAGQTDSCTDAATTPVLTSKNSGSSKKTGRFSKRGHQ